MPIRPPEFKEHLRKVPPKCIFHTTGLLSLVSLTMIYISFKIALENPQQVVLQVPLWMPSFSATFDYSLNLSMSKMVESSFTLVAWLSTIFLKSWKKVHATCFFLGYNGAILNTILTAIFGVCYLASCRADAGCIVTAYLEPSLFVPLCFLFQSVAVGLLYVCTEISNMDVISANENQSSHYGQLFYYYFGKISTDFQLIGIILYSSFAPVFLYILYIWYIMCDLQAAFNTTYKYNMALVTLGILSKLLLITTTTYGFKKKSYTLLASAFFMLVLCILLIYVNFIAFLLAYTDTTSLYPALEGKNPAHKCMLIFFMTVVYLPELMSIRALFLGYKHYKKFNHFPIEYDDRLLRIPRSRIEPEKLLGAGQFGEVWLGKLTLKGTQNTILPVAVKKLKASATDEIKCWFLEEAMLLREFEHENVVKPIGLCMDTKPIMLCMEFLDGGSLLDYLHKAETRSCLSQSDLVEIILQVSKACCYLESEKFIHRDIAARNCLISCQTVHGMLKPGVVKLADFGLAKDVGSRYKNIYKTERSVIPIAYTAQEGLNGSFHIKSDVWSFGVLVWEVFTWCATPFGKCHQSYNDEHRCSMHEYTLQEVEALVLMHHKTLFSFPDPCTANFTHSLKDFLIHCWKYKPSERPNFQTIKLRMEDLRRNCTESPCFPFGRIQELNTAPHSHQQLNVSFNQDCYRRNDPVNNDYASEILSLLESEADEVVEV